MADGNTSERSEARRQGRRDIDHFAHLIAERGGDSIVFTDTEGYVEWANAAFEKLSGYGLEEMRGRKPGDLLQGPDTDPETVAMIRQAIRNRETVRTEILNYSKSGDRYWIDIMIQPVFDDADRLVHFMSIERDISERRRLLDEMSRALEREAKHRRERKLLTRASEWFYMAEDMTELRMIVPRAMELFFPRGHGALYVYSNSRDTLERSCAWGGDLGPAHLYPGDCWALRRGRAYEFNGSSLDFPCSHIGSESEAYYCLPIMALGDTIGLLHVRPSAGDAPAPPEERDAERGSESWELAVLLAEQISLALAKIRVQAQLKDRSVKDALTGLWNRRWFDDTIQREIDTCRGRGLPLSLIFLDVDHFKKFNDNNGHAAGDEVLRIVGETLARHSSRTANPCRIGGEEFAVMCPTQPLDRARALADTIRAEIAEISVTSGGVTLPRVTASAGVAQLTGAEGAAEIMTRADKALYSAKEEGRDRSVIAGPAQEGASDSM